MRLFVAFRPPAEARGLVLRAIEGVTRLAPEARWVDDDTLHLSLCFLGDVDGDLVPDINEALTSVASRHAPLRISFSGAGVFGGRRPRVLWAGVVGSVEALVTLQRELAVELEALGFPPEDRAFTPHLTLARARGQRGDPGLSACASALAGKSFGSAEVEEIVLVESHLASFGPTYEDVSVHPLAGAPGSYD